ncbi:unannotated protein [freshwater metagenome]|uniref:Unannotated protein n=1 Tax=freshwater metagenome TaxID=449393 RepID=A0A6J7U7R5_9ZZZZ
MRFNPALAKGAANSGKRIPLVVSVNRGALVRPAMRSTISTMSGRSKGSPPVKRTSSMPCSTATSIINKSSSVVSKFSDGNHAAKSCGMQYVHRSEQRSVSETRKLRCVRPYVSIRVLMPY